MKRIRGILLDIDGTMLDSNDAHARAWVEALTEFGVEATFDKLRGIIGKGGDKVLPEVAHVDADSERGHKISARRSALFLRKYLPHLAPFRDARELVLRAQSAGLKAVVATSATDEELSALLHQANLADLLFEKATSSDAARSKPDPDIVQAAVKRAGIPPRELLMLGDTPYDVEASSRAGVAAIALRCGGWTDAELSGAIAIYDDPKDLLARYDASPLAN